MTRDAVLIILNAQIRALDETEENAQKIVSRCGRHREVLIRLRQELVGITTRIDIEPQIDNVYQFTKKYDEEEGEE